MWQILDPEMSKWNLSFLGLKFDAYILHVILVEISALLILKYEKRKARTHPNIDIRQFDSDRGIYIDPAFKAYTLIGFMLSLVFLVLWSFQYGVPEQIGRIVLFICIATITTTINIGVVCSFINAIIKLIGRFSKS